MSDQDRGAYTPPTDEPLGFDPRPRKKAAPAAASSSNMPLTLVVSVSVLVLLIGAVVFAYTAGHHGTPRDVGQQVAAGKTDGVVDAKPATDDKEMLSPAAKPAAAPQPSTPAVAGSIGASEAPPPPAAAPPPLTHPSAQAPSVATPAKPAAAPIEAPASQADTRASNEARAKMDRLANDAAHPVAKADVKPAVKTERAAVLLAGPSATATLVQLCACSTREKADATYADTMHAFGSLAARGSEHIEQIITQDGKTLYRASVAGFATRERATAFCEALKESGRSCFVK